MEIARAAIQVTSAAAAETRVAAIPVLARRADPEMRALLSAVAADDSVDASVREAAAEALETIEEQLEFWRSVGTIFQGISLGSVLLLAAVGLAITFGVMGVINMAHGELVMLGAYATFVVQQVIQAVMPGAMEFSLVVAVPTAFLVSGAFGVAIERGIIRFLYGRPLETLLATWGLSLILRQIVRTVFGPTNREVTSPSWMSGAVETVGGLVLTYNRISIIIFALVVLALIGALFRWTRFGLQVRAVIQNRRMAGSMGIRTGPGRCAHLRPRRRQGRRRAEPDRQRQPQSGSGLHHRFIHGRGVRRRRQSVGHPGRRFHARRHQQVHGAVHRRRAGQDPCAGRHHLVHPEAPERAVRPQGPRGGELGMAWFPRGDNGGRILRS